MEIKYTFGGYSETLRLPELIEDEDEYKQVYEKAKATLDHLLNTNSFDNDTAKSHIMSIPDLPDTIKQSLYNFYKHQGRAVITKISQKTAVSSYQGITDIEWDVNIIAGGKGLDKLFKRVAIIKIDSEHNDNGHTSLDNDKPTGQIEFEVDQTIGNKLIEKLADLERVVHRDTSA